MTARVQSQCTPSCARFVSPMNPANTTGVIACAAFPAGIPDKIWNNQVDHRRPVEGDHGLQWTPNAGYTYPVYALNPDPDAATMVAADMGEHTGAMVALVPSDPQALAQPGGEPADQLHCTLLYLGEAADLEEDDRAAVLAAAEEIANGWPTSDVMADAFGVAAFNPTGDEPCLVLLLSGDEITDVHEQVAEAIPADPDQHRPFIPHVTVVYSNVFGYGTSGDDSASTAGSSSQNRDNGGASGNLSSVRSDAIAASALGLDSTQSTGQRDPGSGSRDGWESDPARGGRSPYVWDSEVRGALASGGEVDDGPLHPSRGGASAGVLFASPDSLRAPVGAGLGSLPGVRQGGNGAVQAAASGSREGVSAERSGARLSAAGAGQASAEARDQGASSGVPTDAAGQVAGWFGRLSALTGQPVLFDRLRVAFAGEVTDFPFGGAEPEERPEEEAMPEPEPEPVAEAPVAAAAPPVREVWAGCPRCFNAVHDGPCRPGL